MARSRVVRAAHCVARCSGKRARLAVNGIATAGTMVAKTDTAEFYIIKYKVTDMYNY